MFFVLQLNRHTRKPMLISSTASSEVHTQQGTNSRSTSAPTAINTIPIVLAFEPFLTTVRRRLVQYPPISIASPLPEYVPAPHSVPAFLLLDRANCAIIVEKSRTTSNEVKNMEKIKTTVRIAGKEYAISSYDSEAYVQNVAAWVDRKMKELAQATRLPTGQLAVLAAVNATDDMMKSREEIRRLKQELESARAEIERLKHEQA